MNETKEQLIYKLQIELVGVFISRGFKYHPLTSDEITSSLSGVFPLGRYKKDTKQGVQIIEVQFDKYKRLKFVVNYGVCPYEGITLPWGEHLEHNELGVSALQQSYRLYNSKFFKKWFEAYSNAQSIEKVTQSILKRSNEIFTFFECGEVGSYSREL